MYGDLKKSNKKDLDNYDLSKIFEYYYCIKLSEELLRPFYEYDVRKPGFPNFKIYLIIHIHHIDTMAEYNFHIICHLSLDMVLTVHLDPYY